MLATYKYAEAVTLSLYDMTKNTSIFYINLCWLKIVHNFCVVYLLQRRWGAGIDGGAGNTVAIIPLKLFAAKMTFYGNAVSNRYVDFELCFQADDQSG